MKPMIYPVVGLLVGTLGGTMYGGMQGRDVLLAEKTALEAEAHLTEEAEVIQHEAADLPEVEAPSEDHDPPPENNDPALTEQTGGPEGEHGGADDAADGFTQAGSETQEPLPAPVTDDPPDPVIEAGPVEDTTSRPTSGFSSPESGGPTRLAKIFGAMKAPDAAKVLQNLEDEEVGAILSHLTDRKAAEILGNFEPARAAALSRIVLGSSGGDGQ